MHVIMDGCTYSPRWGSNEGQQRSYVPTNIDPQQYACACTYYRPHALFSKLKEGHDSRKRTAELNVPGLHKQDKA